MIDWIPFIIQFVGLLTPCGLLYYSINRKLKKVEVKDKEIEVIRKQDDEWQELYLEAKSKLEKYEAKLEEILKRLDDVNQRSNVLELENLKLQWYRCIINGCKKRQPPHFFDASGTEVAASDVLQLCN